MAHLVFDIIPGVSVAAVVGLIACVQDNLDREDHWG